MSEQQRFRDLFNNIKYWSLINTALDAHTKCEGKTCATLPFQLCDLVASLFSIFHTSMRKPVLFGVIVEQLNKTFLSFSIIFNHKDKTKIGHVM